MKLNEFMANRRAQLEEAQARAAQADEAEAKAEHLVIEGASMVQAYASIPVATAGVFIDGFEPWAPEKVYKDQYSLFSYDGKVGFTRQANVTAQAHQPPFSAGMESVYGVRPAPDDSGVYPYAYNMAASLGMKVRENGDVWECYNPVEVMLYPPSQLAAHFKRLGETPDEPENPPIVEIPKWVDLPENHPFKVGDKFVYNSKTYEVLREFNKQAGWAPPALIDNFYKII